MGGGVDVPRGGGGREVTVTRTLTLTFTLTLTLTLTRLAEDSLISLSETDEDTKVREP